MRSFCDGRAFARPGHDLDLHEWAVRSAEEIRKSLAVGEKIVEKARDELALKDETGAFNWRNGAYLRCWELINLRERHVTRYERLAAKLPSHEPDAAFAARSGYYILDRSGHCIGIAIKVEQTDRTGSWRDSKDWWWPIRPDGRCGDAKSLKAAAEAILRIEEEDIERRRLQRLDDDVLAELV
ncbi:hypothetical protein HPT29_027700 (plasmid) [Microvirga terrae]|uniref:Uncharacterized protein n=1 Tax=Microvirga terrae TaxID=2740529 RepID=A0ABY5S2S5_9HYPH|nr:hypothetical protein [Microvirga terrae]UVF22806.1 hypothetical protein HPT29_027700 [Microvirga terrae]